VGKLVRDRIPDIIRARGAAPQTRVLDDSENLSSLFDKLLEEAQEMRRRTPQNI
jgi:predicted house-cleaning noncanonical NTP pyrophosphatase (MazG superfamily)